MLSVPGAGVRIAQRARAKKNQIDVFSKPEGLSRRTCDMAKGRYGPAGNGAISSRTWKENMGPIGVPPPGAGDPGALLHDRFGRRLDYLRLSVTDRCNLRCSYCMPSEGVAWVRRSEILSWEEMHRLCRILAECGVRKIRITGGEPLVRLGVVSFIESLRGLPGRPKLLLTTNAVLLERYVDRLFDAGVNRVNISLDSLRRDTFRRLTGRDQLDAAWRGLEAAAARGFALKLNAVIVPGVNDSEIPDFVGLTEKRNLTVRFIEAMPFGTFSAGVAPVLSGDAILDRVRERFSIQPVGHDGAAVEELYRVPGFAGRLGIIRSHARSFCRRCSRLRISAVGLLRTCLYAEPALDLRTALRSGAGAEDIARLVAEAVRERHRDGLAAQATCGSREARGTGRSMSRIGG
jgi:cyclic pyranopterin phosphate synthase